MKMVISEIVKNDVTYHIVDEGWVLFMINIATGERTIIDQETLDEILRYEPQLVREFLTQRFNEINGE